MNEWASEREWKQVIALKNKTLTGAQHMNSKNISEFKQNNSNEREEKLATNNPHKNVNERTKFTTLFFSLSPQKHIIEATFFFVFIQQMRCTLVCIFIYCFRRRFWLIMRICSQQQQQSCCKKTNTDQRIRFGFAFWCGTRYLQYTKNQQSSTSSVYAVPQNQTKCKKKKQKKQTQHRAASWHFFSFNHSKRVY